MKLAIHYMKPEWFRDGIMGVGRPDPANLCATHVFLTDYEASDGVPLGHALEDAFHHFQGEIWSPNGEARGLIESKGLRHTSMSVGDVIVAGDKTFIVASFGFERLATDQELAAAIQAGGAEREAALAEAGRRAAASASREAGQ